MRKLFRALLKFLIITTALRLIGMVVSRIYEGETTASDDDFKLIALMSGRQLISSAQALRTGSALAVVGGIDIDLRSATIDPGGAHVALKAYLGGIRLVVSPEWKVYVDQDARAGGIEVDTVDPEELGDDAPRVTVEALARSGGILIDVED